MHIRLPFLVLVSLALGACDGGASSYGPGPVATPPPPPPVPIPSPGPQVTVDPLVVPDLATIPGINGGPDRPVAALTDDSGIPMNFVENELVVVSDDLAAVQALAQQWGGTVVMSITPSDFGLAGVAQHLLQIDSAMVDPSLLSGDLQTIDSVITGELRVSNDAGLKTFAAAANVSAGGIMAGVNIVTPPYDYANRSTVESPALPICPPGTNSAGCVPGGIAGAAFTSDAYTWSYMGNGAGTQDTGVGEAWRLMSFLGLLANKVGIAVIDGGFMQTVDTPAMWQHDNVDPAVTGFPPSPLPCGGGSACPWHGTNVVSAAMAVPDDMQGVAGPAGPVAQAQTYRQVDSISAASAIYSAWARGARVINMSFGARIPALAAFSGGPPERVTKTVADAGLLLVAAAGNSAVNVDENDCFGVCWEEAWWTPCENDGVFCVGALADNSDQHAAYSNWGDDDVEMFGPGTVWVGPDGVDPEPRDVQGTSFAAPFVAGVGALVMAANPALTGDEVAQILQDTANGSSDSFVLRRVNAYKAVVQAISGTPVCLLPETATGPMSRDAAPCTTNLFSVVPREDGTHFGPFQFVWRKLGSGAPLELSDDGRITGSRTNLMTIDPTLPADAGIYDVLMTNPCGSSTGGQAVLRIVDGAFTTAPAMPSGRMGHAMAFDSVRGQMVVYGGQEGNLTSGYSFANGTFLRNANGLWSTSAATGPSPRAEHGMAFDAARGVSILFGGGYRPPGNFTSWEYYNDTWTWDGATWTQVATTGPQARRWSAMAYDVSRQRVQLYGGFDQSFGIPLTDHWEWDGSAWVGRATTPDPVTGTFPPANSNPLLAYDTSRNVLMLHVPGHGETWELVGSEWHRLAVAPSPSSFLRSAYGIAFDSDTGKLLLLTVNSDATGVTMLLWEWSGTEWLSKATIPLREAFTVEYDPVRQRTTFVGGRSGGYVAMDDVQEWQFYDLNPVCPAP